MFRLQSFLIALLLTYLPNSFAAPNCGTIWDPDRRRIEELSSIKPLLRQLKTFTSMAHSEPSYPLKVMQVSFEMGEVPGLKNAAGRALNISAGGVGTVMTDLGRDYPRFLKQRGGGELTMVGLLMDGIPRNGLKHKYNVKAHVDGVDWNIGVLEYQSPTGARYLLLDNPSFLRFTAMPDKSQSIYTFRGLDGSEQGKFEEQRIWSAASQAVAEIQKTEKFDAVVINDYHMAPAAFYMQRSGAPGVVFPLIHNEAYQGPFYIGDAERTRRIWNLSHNELNEYFRHGDHLVMLAPALRVSERQNVHSAASVSTGTADSINHYPYQIKSYPTIDFFHRVVDLTNGFSKENGPSLSPLLKPTSEVMLKADGIHHPEVVERFKTKGFSFGFPKQADEEIFKTKDEAKVALQKNFGMKVDPNVPLYISFARLVHQKGMEFVAKNIEHILNRGGQIIVGGPVGDSVGAHERQMFIDLKMRLEREKHPHAKNFVFIDGPVKGSMKGLVLAGGDFFLIPSRFEPCGLTDVEALAHGMQPIAHHTGGLSKSQVTRLYGPSNPDDQGWDLGQAIDKSFADYRNRPQFRETQRRAMQEDFSMEKNFERLNQILRIEVYVRMMKILDEEIRSKHVTLKEAEDYLRSELFFRHNKDMKELEKSLTKLHHNRRSPLMNWVLSQLKGA